MEWANSTSWGSTSSSSTFSSPGSTTTTRRIRRWRPEEREEEEEEREEEEEEREEEGGEHVGSPPSFTMEVEVKSAWRVKGGLRPPWAQQGAGQEDEERKLPIRAMSRTEGVRCPTSAGWG